MKVRFVKTTAALAFLLSWIALLSTCSETGSRYRPSFQLEWTASGELNIYSSPRAFDVNRDGVLDVVIGHGKEILPKAGYITARDGNTGEDLWRVEAADELFGSPGLVYLTEDEIPDVVIGGRNAQLYAIDGATGEVLWSFYPQGDARKEGWFNFYSPQFLDDVDGDGVPDLLIANGGNSALPPFYPRPPGHLMVLSGRTGAIIAAPKMPDEAETYMSALIYERASDGQRMVVFGSGGETHRGSLWVVPLADVIAGDISSAQEIIPPIKRKGAIAPPALADLTGDGTVDIIAATFDGRLVAIDGESFKWLWWHQFSDAETWATPAVGFFDDDNVPDVFASFSLGSLPNYRASRHVAVAGATGSLLWEKQFDLPLISSPLAADLSGDDLDEVIITISPLDGSSEQAVLLLNPAGWKLTELIRRPARSFGTGLIIDLDHDGFLEFIYSGMSSDFWTLERRALDARSPERVNWGAYLGTDYDGHFR